MAVSDAAVKRFLEILSTSTNNTCDPDTAAKAISGARSELGKRPVALDQQADKVSEALRLLKAAVIETDSYAIVAWSERDWSETLWKLLEASVSGTLSGHSCSETLDSIERWHECLLAAMQGTTREAQHRVGVWWSSRCYTVTALMVVAALSFAL